MANTDNDRKDRTNEGKESETALNVTAEKIHDYVSTGETEKVNRALDNEAEKADETSRQDFESFDVEKADELKEAKKDSSKK